MDAEPPPDLPPEPTAGPTPPSGEDHGAGGHADDDLLARRAAGRERAERELRVAVVIGIVALALGQVLLLAGLGPLALVAIAVPGTAASLVLARRWSRIAAGEPDP